MTTTKNKLISMAAALAIAGFGQAADADCPADGATPLMPGSKNPINGFPLYFQDSNNIALELCLEGDGATGLCLFDPPVPGNAFSQAIGFGAEAFWWSADATIDLPNRGRAILVQGIEAAFLTEEPIDGDQFPFTRLRIRIDIPADGRYVVTTPYGRIVYDIVGATNNRDINDSFDIEVLGFNTLHLGRVGPILTWDPDVAPAAPAGFVGDPAVPHRVVGSPCGNNFFRIRPPANVDLGNGPGNAVTTRLFNVQGKLATSFGAQIDRASYNRNNNGSGRVDVVATSFPNRTIEVSGIGNQHRIMVEEPGTGKYFARMSFNTNNFVPTDLVNGEVTVTNLDDPNLGAATAVSQVAVDTVTVNLSRYHTDTLTLELSATSNDGSVVQNIEFFDQAGNSLGTALSGADLTIGPINVPPSVITARSSGGGSETREVEIRGPNVFQ